ncbi:MAG: hypothetical protein QM780_04335 [Hyphomicrobium sp.]|uniref:hypothetical protein n=1 Tax=Hyphomicrobium sp. TaxID=82 RepID=UPI0039E48CE3
MAKWRRRSQPSDTAEQRPANFDLPRFLKLCAMLASPSEGERASAAVKASEMLKAANLSWQDVVKDSKTLNEHIALGNAREEEVRAHRFWKTSGSSERARA